MNTPDFKNDREAVLAVLEANAPPENFGISEANNKPARANPAPSSPEELRRLFRIAAENNAATVCEVAGDDDIPAAAAKYLKDNDLPMSLLCADSLSRLNWQSAGVHAETRAAKSEDRCAITETTAAAADTGAMLVTNRAQYQLTHSLLPAAHIAILRAADIMPDLPSVWKKLRAKKGAPLLASLICGPSRTADIEQTLTLGVHGPVSVHVIVVGE